MSDINDLLKSLAGDNNDAVNLVGGVIGTLANFADISGGSQVLLGLINLFSSSPQDDPVLGKLHDLQTEIHQGFAAVNAEARAQNILTRWNNLDPPVAQAQSVLDQLKDVVSKVPPVSEEYRLQLIQLCLDAVEQFTVLPLNQDSHWLTSFSDEIYYGSYPGASEPIDQWTGVVAPTPNPDGTVFSDRYVLPYYMRALSAFMLTATALEPGYQTRYKETLQRFAARLQEAYDMSWQGIIIIRQPTASQVGIDSVGYIATFSTKIYPTGYLYNPQDNWGHPFAVDPDYVSQFVSETEQLTPEGKQTVNSQFFQFLQETRFQEYGVVHTYSGYSDISYYPPIPKPTVTPDVFLLQFYAKLNLAIRRNWKEAYAAIGLSEAWKTINALRKLTGDPPLARSDPNTTWSLREIGQILGSAFRDPSAPAPAGISAADVISGLATAGGITAAWAPLTVRPLALRPALAAALSAATIGPIFPLK